MTIEEIADRLAIADVLYRYATALDTRDWELLREVFMPDAVTEYEGDVGSFTGVDQTIAIVSEYLGGYDATQHLISNIVVDVDGDVAQSTCYLHAEHYMTNQRIGGNTLEIGGTYRDRLVRTDGGWRIAHRYLAVTWTEGNLGIQAESRRRSREGA
jgi:3-phenylpropionate/cinnamic acid dioxygenase small subunit